MKKIKGFASGASIVAMMVTLVACTSGGSSGSSGNDQPSMGVKLSGKVAAGAPLAGFVAIKDSKGTVVTGAIDVNGNYNVDVQALTPPFVLFASGVAGGRAYTIASAATSDDINGNVNVTPLTDIIVGNVAGKDSEEFFNAPDFTKLTTVALDGAANNLKTRLQPLLTAAGISNFDLMNSSFTTDHTGFDGLLDVLDVTVDPTTDSATISYTLDPAINIVENLTVTTDTGTITAPTTLTSDVAALEAIGLMLSSFNGQFAAGVPTVAALDPYFDPGFMHDGHTKTAMIDKFRGSDPSWSDYLTGFRIAMQGFSIVDLNTVSNPKTATLTFGNALIMKVTDDGTGWNLAGNGYKWVSNVQTETHFDQVHNNVRTEVNFWLNDIAGTEVPLTDYFVITGPGLPTAGVVMVQYAFNSFTNAQSKNDWIYGYTVTDTITKTIADGSQYTITRWRDTNGDTNVYDTSPAPVDVNNAATLTGKTEDTQVDQQVRTLIKRPLLSTESTVFATITAPTAANLQNFTSGLLTVSWTLPAGSKTSCVTLDRTLSTGEYQRADENCLAGDALSTTLDILAPSTTINSQSVIVFTEDAFGRTAATNVGVTMGVTTTPPPVASLMATLLTEGLYINAGNEVRRLSMAGAIGYYYEYDFNYSTALPAFALDTSHAPWRLSTNGVWHQFIYPEEAQTTATVNPDGTVQITTTSGTEVYQTRTFTHVSSMPIAGYPLLTTALPGGANLRDPLWTDSLYGPLVTNQVFSTNATVENITLTFVHDEYQVWVDGNCDINCNNVLTDAPATVATLGGLFGGAVIDVSNKATPGTVFAALGGALADGAGTVAFTDSLGAALGSGTWTTVTVGTTTLIRIVALSAVNPALLWDGSSALFMGELSGLVRHIGYAPAGVSVPLTPFNAAAATDIAGVVTIQ